MPRVNTLRKAKPQSEDELGKATDRLFAVLSEKISHLPPDEQKKKWDDLKKYVNAASAQSAKRP